MHRFNHTSWKVAGTPTDRPKAVRKSGVIKKCWRRIGVVIFLLSVSISAFVIGLTQIFVLCIEITVFDYSCL